MSERQSQLREEAKNVRNSFFEDKINAKDHFTEHFESS